MSNKLFVSRASAQWDKAIFMLVLTILFTAAAFGETNGTLNGEVFIVTKAAENIRLGLVDVKVFGENDITNQIAKGRQRIKADQPEFDKLMAPVDQQLSVLEENTVKLKTVDDKASDVDSTTKKVITEWKEIKVLARENWLSSEYFKDLPTPLTSTITDADGKFSLAIPKQNRFTIAAHASRDVLGMKEQYYWMVWVSLNGKDSANIILGNQNLMSSGSQDSVVSTKSD